MIRLPHNTRAIRITVACVVGLLVIGVAVRCWQTSRVRERTVAMQFGTTDAAALNPDIALTEATINGVRVSAPQFENGVSYRELSSGAMDWTWTPNWPLQQIDTLSVSLTLADATGALTIGTPDDRSTALQTLPLYIPGMETMQKSVVNVSGRSVHVYTADGVDTPAIGTSLETYLQSHTDTPATITSDVSSAIDWNVLNADMPTDTTTTQLNANVYGNATFVLRAPKQFTLSLQKTNVNLTRVDDGATLEIRNQRGELVAHTLINSDGIENAKHTTTTQDVLWSPTLPEDGVYTLHIIKTDSASHPFFSHITVNTPYIALRNGIVQTDAPIHTRVTHRDLPLNLRLLHNPGMTTLDFVSDADAQATSYTSAGQELITDHVGLPASGDYTFSYPDRLELIDGWYALGNAKLFSPTVLTETDIRPRIIVTGSDLTQNNNILTVTNSWPADAIHHMRRADKTATVPFVLTEEHLEQPTAFAQILASYMQLWNGCGVAVFSKDQFHAGSSDAVTCTNAADVANAVQALLPPGGTLTNLSSTDVSSLFTTVSDIENQVTRDTDISATLHGNHEFAVYAPDGLQMTVEITDLNNDPGSDTVVTEVTDPSGHRITSTRIADDGNTTDNGTHSAPRTGSVIATGSTSGIYRVTIASTDLDAQDFLITHIHLNTNKIIALDHVWTQLPADIFTSVDGLSQVTVYANGNATKDADDDVVIDAGTDNETLLALSQQNDHQNLPVVLRRGAHTIHTGTTQVQLNGIDTAFTADGFFSVGPYRLGLDAVAIDDASWGQTRLYDLSLHYAR